MIDTSLWVADYHLEKGPIIVSACLAGINCRYDGGNCLNGKVVKLVKMGKAIPLCPEQLGGLTTPRLPCCIVGGDGYDVIMGRAKVKNIKGEDVTRQFLKGAEEVANFALLIKIEKGILMQASPSCGFGKIYHDQRLVEGVGVTTAKLLEMGVEILTLGKNN